MPAFAGMTAVWVATRSGRLKAISNLLIVLADFGMGAQHAVHHLEHVVHALLGDRALDHDDELGLVGGSAYQAPAAILDRDPHAVDGDEVADRLAADLGALRLQSLKVL